MWDINISYLNVSFANAVLETGSFKSDDQAPVSERLNEPCIFRNAEQWEKGLLHIHGQDGRLALTVKLPAPVLCKTLSKATRDIGRKTATLDSEMFWRKFQVRGGL